MNQRPTPDNAPKENAPARARAESKSDTNHHNGNSADSQRSRILEWFRTCNTLTTLQARQQLDVMHPAARVQELKSLGYRIDTVWTTDTTQEGKAHRVAKYVYQP
ncbi:MAG: helix-turn-helix domain-containing protein [Sulfuricella sp.]